MSDVPGRPIVDFVAESLRESSNWCWPRISVSPHYINYESWKSNQLFSGRLPYVGYVSGDLFTLGYEYYIEFSIYNKNDKLRIEFRKARRPTKAEVVRKIARFDLRDPDSLKLVGKWCKEMVFGYRFKAHR